MNKVEWFKNSNMDQNNNVAQELSPVEQMFQDRSVFITGASGFIGRVLVEKLLRCYPGIKRIYILMRTKRSQSPTERLHSHLLSAPIFDAIKAQPEGQQMLNEKLVVVPGDIALPQLGISEEDLQAMLADPSLSIVIHTAATIKYDEPLKVATRLNMVAIREIVSLCRRLPNLISLCHVSTAYVNGHMKDGQEIEEQVYPINESPDQVIELSELLEENVVQEYKEKLVGERPNTYTYTKALAEHLLIEEAKDLPVAIVRPSIVVSAWKEPMPGWIDNMNGSTGLLLAWGMGFLRTNCVVAEVKADLVPVDVVVNTMIASTFYAAKRGQKLGKKLVDLEEKEKAEAEVPELQKQTIPIVHCTSGDPNPITWGNVYEYLPIMKKFPSTKLYRYPAVGLSNNKHLDLFYRIFVHYLPALIIDLILFLRGKKRKMMRIYEKLHKSLDSQTHFSLTNYNFKSKNSYLLEEALEDERDKQTLYMNIEKMDWSEFWHHYMLGARRYVLKEPDETLAKARRKLKSAYYKEIALKLILVSLIGYFLLFTSRSTAVTETHRDLSVQQLSLA